MGERSGYAPGTFCWAELATSDQDGAKAFYAELLGWESDDRPVGEGSVYSMQLRDGKHVAAIAGQPQQQRDAGVPPLWNSYVWVDDADAAVAQAVELGATAHAPQSWARERKKTSIGRVSSCCLSLKRSRPPAMIISFLGGIRYTCPGSTTIPSSTR